MEETVTIKKNGVIISTVQTNSIGESSELELPIGTYTLVGSVSGYEGEQVVDVDTSKFMAMPDGAIYWYGNECSEVTGGWSKNGYSTDYTLVSGIKNKNSVNLNNSTSHTMAFLGTANKIDISNYTKLNNQAYYSSAGYGTSIAFSKEKAYCTQTGLFSWCRCTSGKTSFNISKYDNKNLYIEMINAYELQSTYCTTATVYAIWLE